MLDFVRDIYSSFRQTSLERVKSPFLGAFVFSWIGFNWPMLAVLFFSKKDVEVRLNYINGNFDIGSYLLGPICTTILISIFLPQINKFITRIQDKPNSDTVELSLTSKIRIAELQQSLAESEARKKLADKKEERFIEEGIHSIKKDLEKTKDDLLEREAEISTLLKGINDLQGQLAKAESKFSVEQSSKVEIQKEIIIEKENNRALGEQVIKLNTELQEVKIKLSSAENSYSNTQHNLERLKNTIERTERAIMMYAKRYQNLVRINKSEFGFYLTLPSTTRKLLRDNNQMFEIMKRYNTPNKN
ncbi:TPA: hypothetical protein ACNUZK_002685 [Citrobacter braakii]